MHEFRVPPAHAWYTMPTCSPDHGLLYIAGNHTCVGYIPSPQNETGRVQMVDLRSRCKALVSDIIWDQTRWFITLDEENTVATWDLNTETIVRGHRAHCNGGNESNTDDGAMCITSDRKVLTIAADRFSSFCLRSNTYSLFKDDFITKRQRVTAIKASIYTDHIIAVGYKKGLVVIANIKDTTILHTLRGHDADILYMEWMCIDPSDIKKDEMIRRRDQPNSDTASASSDQQSLVQLELNSDTMGVEASIDEPELNVNDKLRATSNSPPDTVEKESGSPKIENIESDDLGQQVTSTEPLNGISTDETIAEIGTIPEDSTASNGNQLKYYLATSTQEAFIYIWDTESGKIMHKINLKSHGKSKIPKPIAIFTWISSTELLINNPNGTVCQWKIKVDVNSKEKCVVQNRTFSEKGVIGICCSRNDVNDTYIYILSISSYITSHLYRNDADQIIGKYSTLPIGMYSIRECPHDSNKIAIAGNNKKIGILDTLTMTSTNVDIQWLTAKIQSKVLALAWHPYEENILSYSTTEGRIGTFDLSKPNTPYVLDKFCGKHVYQIDYGTTDENCSLYACNMNNIAVFPDSFLQKQAAKCEMKQFDFTVSSLSTCNGYLTIGTNDGVFKLMTLDYTVLFEKKLSAKYISNIRWHKRTKRHVAVASMDNSIHLFEFVKEENKILDTKELGVLYGHTLGVTWVYWSDKSVNRLVSTSFDNTVRVWNTETAECLALCEYNDKMYCAVFMPENDNLIAASGKSETLHIFDVSEKKFNASISIEVDKKSKRVKLGVTWANEIRNGEVCRHKEARNKKKGQMKVQTAVPTEQTNNVQPKLQVERKPQISSIFHLSSRETNRDGIDCILNLLKNERDDEKSYLIADIATKSGVQKIISKELENTKICAPDDAGNILLPQLNNDLKSEILVKVEGKLLTATHVSLAPSVSFEFWKKCCSAFAYQNIEKGFVLEAIPYLLAIHETREAIDILCEKNFYREAWVVAKMKKDPDDKLLFDGIAEKWINYLVSHGNLEGGAMTAVALAKPQQALEILKKRKTTTPEIDEVIGLLENRITLNAVKYDA